MSSLPHILLPRRGNPAKGSPSPVLGEDGSPICQRKLRKDK